MTLEASGSRERPSPQEREGESPPFTPPSMRRGALGPYARLRADILRLERRALARRLPGIVRDGEHPAAQERQRHRKDGRRRINEERASLGIAEHRFPDARTENGQHDRADQTGETADEGAARRKVLPGHRQQKDGEIRARGDREGEADHKRDIDFLEDDAEHYGDDAEDDGRYSRRTRLRSLIDPAVTEHAGVQVVADRARA